LLEDDYDVDWEVDWNEPTRGTHPHRVPLCGQFVSRRPRQPAPTSHLCLSPIAPSSGTPRGRPDRSPGKLCESGVAQKL